MKCIRKEYNQGCFIWLFLCEFTEKKKDYLEGIFKTSQGLAVFMGTNKKQ